MPTEKQIKYFYFLAHQFQSMNHGFRPRDIQSNFDLIDIIKDAIKNNTLTSSQLSNTIKILKTEIDNPTH